MIVRSIPILLALAACTQIPPPPLSQLSSFKVEIRGIYQNVGANRVSLPVVATCAKRYGGQAKVPDQKPDGGGFEKGSAECRYAIARGEAQIDVTATALDTQGAPALTFNGPVSFRVVPGDLTGGYPDRQATATGGVVQATVRSQHQYGGTRLWAEDAPPKLIFADGGVVGGQLDEPAHRTFATGLSPVIYFEEPTLATVQIPDGADNRSSPLVGQFLTIGKTPESGERLLQACTDDPKRDGQPALMVVTGTDPSGFYVTDISACRLIETTSPRTFEPKEPCQVHLNDGAYVAVEAWDGGNSDGATPRCQISQTDCTQTIGCAIYQPGTYGSMFIYNYSFPDGLDQGDLLWTLSGSVQEFTSTTQLTFPSWSIAEKVRQLPPDQWNKWLQYARPVTLGNRACGADDKIAPYITDQLCGHNKTNMKMESLESALVRLPAVRFPTDFFNCDFNSNGTVPFFCEHTQSAPTFWGNCNFGGEFEPPADAMERQCTSDCVTAQGMWTGKVCSERSTFTGFGQFVVEMQPSGPADWGFDESLPGRIQHFTATSAPAGPTSPYAGGTEINVGCDGEVRMIFGDATASATLTDPLVAPNTVINHTLGTNETTVSVISTKGVSVKCWLAQNAHSRFNLITKDALPELNPDCKLDDADAAKATQCKLIRSATFDVIGHLRQVQPARPRWTVTPRDADDVCCHPGQGLDCPKPVKPCP